MSCICVHTLSGYSKVSQFGNALNGEEDVCSFDIAMYFFMFMQVGQSFESGLEYGGDLALI